MTLRIPLSGKGAAGLYLLVDAADAGLVEEHRWYPLRNDHTTYVRTRVPGNHSIYVHRLLFGLERHDRRVVDHIDHDGLDNRRSNLRLLNQGDNMANRKGAQSNGRTGVLGVCFDNGRQRYMVSLAYSGRRLMSRRFDSAVAAAEYRNAFIIENALPHSLSDIDAAAKLDAESVAA